jgi:hypothetical protein
MLGHGFYNKHSHEQGKANAFALPLIAEAINQIYYRTAEEWKEPFTSDSNFAQTLALSLDHFEEARLPDIYLEQFEQDGDAQAFAESYTAFFKAAFEPCLFISLCDTRTPQNRKQVIDSFSEKLHSALGQDPQRFYCRWVLHLMLISKKQK